MRRPTDPRLGDRCVAPLSLLEGREGQREGELPERSTNPLGTYPGLAIGRHGRLVIDL